MYASHLRKHILTNNRLIGCYADAAEAFHHPREVVQLTLYNVRLGVELVFQDCLYGGHRRIAATLP